MMKPATFSKFRWFYAPGFWPKHCATSTPSTGLCVSSRGYPMLTYQIGGSQQNPRCWFRPIPMNDWGPFTINASWRRCRPETIHRFCRRTFLMTCAIQDRMNLHRERPWSMLGLTSASIIRLQSEPLALVPVHAYLRLHPVRRQFPFRGAFPSRLPW